jgi:GNAT superfamily N-acetyltransferase
MIEIDVVPWDHPDGIRLREAQRIELDDRYGGDLEPGAKPNADTVAVFVVARNETATALGCGGLRLLNPGTAEIKRMYVTPEARGTGVSVALLHALEDWARERGITRLLLETGTAQPDAIRFYQREGYERIDNFGPYRESPISVCFARNIADAVRNTPFFP